MKCTYVVLVPLLLHFPEELGVVEPGVFERPGVGGLSQKKRVFSGSRGARLSNYSPRRTCPWAPAGRSSWGWRWRSWAGCAPPGCPRASPSWACRTGPTTTGRGPRRRRPPAEGARRRGVLPKRKLSDLRAMRNRLVNQQVAVVAVAAMVVNHRGTFRWCESMRPDEEVVDSRYVVQGNAAESGLRCRHWALLLRTECPFRPAPDPARTRRCRFGTIIPNLVRNFLNTAPVPLFKIRVLEGKLLKIISG